MDKDTHQIRLQRWTQIIQECSNSTLTKNAWCLQNDIPIKTYYYWQRKVRQHLAESALLPAEANSPAFVELKEPVLPKVEHDQTPDCQNPIPPITPAAVIQKNGFTVILSNSASQSFIRMLLGALNND